MPWRGARGRSRAVLAVLALFLLLHLPTLAEVTHYHSDERFYTDAALEMGKSGDWLRPRYSDGSERLNKPLLAYWAIAASQALFGPGLLASRLPFLLAGCVVLWGAAVAAREMWKDERAALLAAVVLFSSSSIRSIATRATPDVLLVAACALGWVGFARVLYSERPSARSACLGWGATGVAAAAKGGLAIALGIHALLGAARAGRTRLARLLHPGALLLGALLTVAGYAWLFVRRGGGGIEQAWDDQVGGRLASSPLEVLRTCRDYLLSTLRHFLPWTLLAAAVVLRASDRRRVLRAIDPPVTRYALGWYVLLLVVFSVANIARARYLTPAYPMLGALAAGVLVTAIDEPRWCARMVAISRWSLRALAVGVAVLAVLAARIDGSISVWLGAIAIAAAAGSTPLALRPCGGLVSLGLVLGLAAGIADLGVRPALDASPVETLVRRCREEGIAGRELALDDFHASIASQIRLVSGGELEPVVGPSAAPDRGEWRAALHTERELSSWTTEGATVERCGSLAQGWSAGEIVELLRAGDPARVVAEHGTPCYLWIRSR